MTTMKPNELSNEKSTDEINRIIHERLMQKCWHDTQSAGVLFGKQSPTGRPYNIRQCTKCSKRGHHVANPNYCSGKSERDLLQGAVARAVEKFGGWNYTLALLDVAYPNDLWTSAEFKALKDRDDTYPIYSKSAMKEVNIAACHPTHIMRAIRFAANATPLQIATAIVACITEQAAGCGGEEE